MSDSDTLEVPAKQVPGEATRWQPGQSGNPKGRPPRGEAFADLLDKYGAMSVRQLRALKLLDMPSKDAQVVRQLLDGVRTANSTVNAAQHARADTFDRVYGKPRQTLEHTGDAFNRYADRQAEMMAFMEADDGNDDESEEGVG